MNLETGKGVLNWAKQIGYPHLLVVTLTWVGWTGLQSFVEFLNTKDRIESIPSLETQILQLQHHYRETNPEELPASLHEVEQALMGNFTQLTQWAQDIQEKGKKWDLQCRYRILANEKTISALDGVTLVPVEIELHPHGPHSGYQGFMNMLRELSESTRRMDFQDITMSGDGQRANHMKIGLTVWMKTTDSVEL